MDIRIPQGNPISPILFLIYIRDLFPKIGPSINTWSYLDDKALVTSFISLKKNIKALEDEVRRLYKLGSELSIEFNLTVTWASLKV